MKVVMVPGYNVLDMASVPKFHNTTQIGPIEETRWTAYSPKDQFVVTSQQSCESRRGANI